VPFLPVGSFYREPAGLFPNEDNAYLASVVTDPTQLAVVRFTPPTTPRTLNGEALDLSTQLRYWSVCVYYLVPSAPPVNSTNACTPDELSPIGPDGHVTVVVAPPGSPPPAGLTGVTWVNLTQPVSYTVVIRHMLPNPSSFAQSAFSVPNFQPASSAMGSYAPTIDLCSPAQLQSCPLPAGALPSPTPQATTPAPPTATLTATIAAPTPAPSATPTSTVEGCAAGGPALKVHVGQGSVRRGDMLQVRLSTASRAHVSLTLQATTTRVMVTGKGKSQKKVRKTVLLYHLTHQGTADAKGAVTIGLPIGYDPDAPTKADLAVSAQAACGTAQRHTPVTIEPLISFHLNSSHAATGGTLTIGAHTLGRARVSINLQVATTKVVVTGKGTSQKKVRKTVVLYRLTYTGTADKYGAFAHSLRVTYKPSKSISATLTVAMQAGHRTASRSVTVTVQPPKRA
jgi:hypothetical protein